MSQPTKADSPILTAPSGIIIEVSPEQYLKAFSPILFAFKIDIDFNLSSQPSKQNESIVSVEIITEKSTFPPKSRKLYSSIFLTVFGIVIDEMLPPPSNSNCSLFNFDTPYIFML